MITNTMLRFSYTLIVLVFFIITLSKTQNTQVINSAQLSPYYKYNISRNTQSSKIGVNSKKQPFSEKSNRKRNSGVFFRDLPPADTSRVLARIGGKVILMDEFIRRAEYTIRPRYCRGNTGFEKKIILNSLLAEKMLALEAGKDNELMKNQSFQRMLRGRKEQLMRQVLYYAEGTSKVQLDTAKMRQEYKVAGRTYSFEFFNVSSDSIAETIKSVLDTLASSFNAIYSALSGQNTLPQKEVSWDSRENEVIHKALFKDIPKKNQIIGPLHVDESYLFIRIKGWTDHVAITEKQIVERWNDVREKLVYEKADDLYDKFIMRIMDGKTLQLEPAAFRKFTEIIAPRYLASKKEKENEIISKFFQKNPQENPEYGDIERNLDALRGASLFTIDNEAWTVEKTVEEMERHPLVFRNRNLNKKNFSEQLKLAIVDMVRDRYLANEAYKRGYDKYPTVAHYTEMWQDAVVSLWQKDIYLDSIGVTDNGETDVVVKYMDPYIDSLRHKYGASAEINVKDFNEFKLTGIDMIALEYNAPFTLFVPPFPQLTTYKWLDYGRKLSSGEQE
jgi:hypothetical protein